MYRMSEEELMKNNKVKDPIDVEIDTIVDRCYVYRGLDGDEISEYLLRKELKRILNREMEHARGLIEYMKSIANDFTGFPTNDDLDSIFEQYKLERKS